MPKRGTGSVKVRNTFPPRPQVLPRAHLRSGFLKSPRAGAWGGGAAEAPSPGRASASGWSGPGWAGDGGGHGAGPGSAPREVRASSANLAAFPHRLSSGPPGMRPAGRPKNPPTPARLRPHVRGGGGVLHKGQAK